MTLSGDGIDLRELLANAKGKARMKRRRVKYLDDAVDAISTLIFGPLSLGEDGPSIGARVVALAAVVGLLVLLAGMFFWPR